MTKQTWEQMTQTWTREDWERELVRPVETAAADDSPPAFSFVLPRIPTDILVAVFAVGMLLYFAAVLVFVVPAHASPPALAAQPTPVAAVPVAPPSQPPPEPTVPAGCAVGRFGLVVCDLRLEVR